MESTIIISPHGRITALHLLTSECSSVYKLALQATDYECGSSVWKNANEALVCPLLAALKTIAPSYTESDCLVPSQNRSPCFLSLCSSFPSLIYLSHFILSTTNYYDEVCASRRIPTSPMQTMMAHADRFCPLSLSLRTLYGHTRCS